MRQISSPLAVPEQASLDFDDTGIQELIDTEFDGQSGLFAEFGALVGPENRERRWVVRDAGRVIAHAAWRRLRLHSGPLRFDAAGIGLVTTARAWRGRGHATALVEACVGDARANGAAVALLFSNTRGLYTRLGFAPAGRERRIVLDLEESSPDVRRARPDDVVALHALLETQPLRVERSVQEFARQLRIPDTHGWVWEGADGIEAYAVEGKGRDLRGVIHEWAGTPERVARIAAVIAAGHSGPTLLVGPEDVPAPVAGHADVSPLAQAKLLRPASGFSLQSPFYVWGLDSF